jgi:branched-chain amino acid transport system substrate-binding protein
MTNFSKRIIRSNRREFIGGSAAAVLLASGLAARAQGAKTIKIGFISPVSGPLAAFGQGDAFVLKQVRAMLSEGYKIGESTYAIEILDRDTQSDPSRAAQLAKELITSASVDLILASSTPETINPVADACEASGVPCVSTVMPWQAWPGISAGARSQVSRARSNGVTISVLVSTSSRNAMFRSGT